MAWTVSVDGIDGATIPFGLDFPTSFIDIGHGNPTGGGSGPGNPTMPSPDQTERIARSIALSTIASLSIAGKIFYVDSGHAAKGDQSGKGFSWTNPFATIDYAIGQCTANNGDVILVAPGHTETVSGAGGIAVDVAGVSIVGMGTGSNRPTINLTATASTVTLSAANCILKNLLFTGGIDAIVTPIVISAADIALLNIETRDVTGQMTSCITTTAAADRLLISGWVHRGAAAAGGATAISFVGGDGISINNFLIFGNFSTAAIENVTTAATNLTISNGFIQNGLDNAAVVAITLVATTTGNVGPNINIRIGVDSTSNAANITEAVVGAAVQFYLPINVCNLGGEVAMLTNITASTDA